MNKRFGFLLTVILTLFTVGVFAQNDDQSGGDAACNSIKIPYYTGFEDTDSQCWSSVKTSGEYPKSSFGSNAAKTGSNSLQFSNGDCIAALAKIEDGEALKDLRLTFYYRCSANVTSYKGVLEVGIMTDNTDPSSFRVVDTIAPQTPYSAWSDKKFINFDKVFYNESKDAYIAFRYTSARSNTFWYIDDLTVEKIPSCGAVELKSLQLVSATDKSAVISFEDNDETHSQWNVYYKSDEDILWQMTEANSDKTADLEDLEPATKYNVFVLTNCGDENLAVDTSDLLTFTTSAVPVNVEGEVFIDFSQEQYNTSFANTSNSVNKWVIGTATGTEEDEPTALYVSNDDGQTNNYSDVLTHAYSVLPLAFDDQAEQTIEFDYKVKGASSTASYGSFSVYLVPAGIEIPQTGYPTGGIRVLYQAKQQTEWTHFSYSTDALSGSVQQLVFYWQNSSSSAQHGDPAAAIDNLRISTTNCAKPKNVRIDEENTTPSSLAITWEQSGNVDSWKVYYRKTGTTEWENPLTSSGTDAVIPGVQSDSYYDVKVTAICGQNETDALEIVTVHSGCDVVQQLPYLRDFDNNSLDCWTIIDTAHYLNWDDTYQTYPIAVNGYLRFYNENSMIATPAFAEDINNLRIKFDIAASNAAATMTIGVMADLSDKETLETVAVLTDESPKHQIISFANTGISGGNNYIVFLFETTKTSVGWSIDNVEVSAIPDCAGPDYNSLSVSEIEDNSAKISFTDPDINHGKWNIYYNEDGSEDVNVAETTDKETVLTLKSATKYNVWVKTVCSNQESEDSTIIVSFTTKSSPVATNYTQTFEDGTVDDFNLMSTNENKWTIGSAVFYGDSEEGAEGKSLYISDDNGEKNHYTSTYTRRYSYAALNVNFGEYPEYELSFDYKSAGYSVSGTGYSCLRVYLLDGGALIPEDTWPEGEIILNDAYSTDGWKHFETNLNNIANSNKQLVFVWQSYYRSGDAAAVDNIKITGNSCAQPSQFKVQSIGDNNAVLSWHENGEAKQWTLYYKKSDDTDYTTKSVSDTLYTLTDLSAETTYQVYVVADCGNNIASRSSQEITFTTFKSMVVIGDNGYAQNFDEQSKLSDVVISSSGDIKWVIGSAAYDSIKGDGQNSNAMYISDGDDQYHYSGDGSVSVAVIPLQFGDKPEYQISFDYTVNGHVTPSSAIAYMDVYLVPSSEQVDAYSVPNGTLLLRAYDRPSWTNFSYGVQNVENQNYQLVFYWYDSYYSYYDYNHPAAVDNIKIEGYTCPRPTDLTLTDITSESVNVSWKSNGNTDKWTLRYREVQGTETVLPITDAVKNADGTVSFLLENLKAGTRYAISVVTNCAVDSDPSDEIEFATIGKLISEFPYFQDFEDSLQNNTVTMFGRGDNQWYIGDNVGVSNQEDKIHSLYISYDNGETNNYTYKSTSDAYAVMNVQFGDQAEYNLEFDFYAGGREKRDNFNVYLIPAGQSIEVGQPLKGRVLMELVYGINTWKHVSYKLDTVSNRQYQLVFYWKNTNDVVTYPAPAIDNIRIEGSDCASVSNLRANERKQLNEIGLQWKDNNATVPQSWTVYYREKDNVSTEYKSVRVFDSSYVIENLAPGTIYSIKVTANCDNESESVPVYMESSTRCTAVEDADGWYEAFNIDDYPENRMIPLCWTRLKTTGSVDAGTDRVEYFPSVITYGMTGVDGKQTSLEFRYSGTIATPVFETNIEDVALTFYACKSSNVGDMMVYVASDMYDTTSWEPVLHIDKSMINTVQSAPFDYTEFTIPFNNIINKGKNRCVIFEYVDNTISSWYIDRLRLTVLTDKQKEQPCAAQISELSIDGATVIDGVTVAPEEQSASMSWESSSHSQKWDYKLNLNGTVMSTVSRNVTFHDLIPGTAYTAYVRTYCFELNEETGEYEETGDVSPWDSVKFTTAGECPCFCPEVTNLTAETVTDNSVKVTWSYDNTESSVWQVAISDLDDASALTFMDIYETFDKEYEFKNLSSSKEYTVFVRAKCKYTVSDWATLKIMTDAPYLAPEVTTVSYSDLTSESILLKGRVLANSATIDKRGFQVKLLQAAVINATPYEVTTDEFEYSVTGLLPETEYTFRAFATNENGTMFYGEWLTFKTEKYIPVAPTVTTYPVEDADIDSTSVTLKGEVILGDEAVDTMGFIYRAEGSARIDTVFTDDVQMSVTVTDLIPARNYTFYAFAITATYNGTGMIKGETLTFTTKEGEKIYPVVITEDASSVEINSVTLNGSFEEGNVEITSYGFVYKSDGEETDVTATVSEEDKTFTVDITGLTAETQYTFYAYVKAGGNIIAGEEKTFTTLAEPIVETDPVVRTADASGIDSVKATLNATVTVTETTKAVVSSGFMYRKATDSEYTTVEAAINNGTMTYELTGLTPDTEYQFAGFVNTADGHLMGDIKTFKTLATSGLAEIANMMLISTYPNPTTSDATLRVEGLNADAQVIMTNTNGQIISTKTLAKGQTEMRIETSGLAAGVYYIRVISDGVTRTEKLIKE